MECEEHSYKKCEKYMDEEYIDEESEEHIHEECGVFGIWSMEGKEVAHTIYQGLLALQHRGQESTGIVVCDTKGPIGNIASHKEMGLVSEVFHEETLEKLRGNIGIGHVRYSTAGGSIIANAQPIVLNYLKGTLALAHNGNITNADGLRKELQESGAVFNGNSDSETIAYKIAMDRIASSSIEEAVQNTVQVIKGGFALLILSPRKLIVARDPLGIKPLCLGKLDDSYIVASESCAITSVGGEFIRDVEPGEILAITQEGLHVVSTPSETKKRAHCIFEYIYFARVDSKIDGISVYDARIRGGRALARRYPVDADVVTGVPDSGLVAAVGYSKESGIPFELAFHKNSYVGRTFIKPTQQERKNSVKAKLNVLESVVKGKRVVLIDDSIVRGTTIANLIHMLRQSGAKEVHVRICAPPFLYPCYYGTDVPSNSELIANQLSVNEICEFIGADSLGYMDRLDFSYMTGDLPVCKACFDNEYPV
ncbi:Amidophosphoribosyltransferase [Lachnospiraceae bacterium TWA4]|nr:Amidophosphoribosyltransferase [Lachnospiraceae bacterium TWA4]